MCTKRKATCVGSSWQRYRERILLHVKFGVHHRGVEHALLQQRWTSQESREELCDSFGEGSDEEIDSVTAIGSMEVGVTCEEPTVLELDGYAEELQNVFDNMSGVHVFKVRRRMRLQVRVKESLDCAR